MGFDIHQEQRIIIKFLVAKVVESAEIYHRLCALCKWSIGVIRHGFIIICQKTVVISAVEARVFAKP